jgi:hypothetical protein
VTFGTELFYLFELADRQDPKFGPAAARWHARAVGVSGSQQTRRFCIEILPRER